MAHNQVEGYAQRKLFASYWSTEALTVALEKGDVFKSLFRVNAHNRVEAYCKIDGVPVDVLINGLQSQNRAVEGDIVAIKVEPISSWTKMKGTIEPSRHPAVEDNNSLAGVSESNNDNCRRKKKPDTNMQCVCNTNGQPFPGKGLLHNVNDTFHGQNDGQDLIRPASSGYIDGNNQFERDHSMACSSSERREAETAVEKLCTMVSSFPSKRPTGRVVAIIEKSPRRKAIVGFLRIKQWLFSKESCKKDIKKAKFLLSSSKLEYIQLIPTDPKYPKMMVPVKTLPNSILKRLEGCDLTLEMELVAAEIVEWNEEYDIPCAHVVHVFGRGGEVESQIAAILFQNAVDSSDFPPEAMACIPRVPWTIPEEEFRHRRDLRNLCTFTIDPATASDLDDALSVERLSNGIYRVGVHIADVSYFVLPHTALDVDAQIRSTSVYLLRHKLPMLPPLLSDNLGSLSPGVERLAFSIVWDINPGGEVLDRWIGRTVVRSCCKLSYEHAQEIIDGTLNVNDGCNCPQLHGRFTWSDVIASVHNLHEISGVLKEKRFKNGALSLETPKTVFLFDEDGIPYDSVLSGRTKSNFLVEELMLLANRTAAEVITRAYPSSALLRRHPEPKLSKLRELEAFCSKQGLQLDTSTSGQLNQSLECIRDELKNDSVLFHVLMNYATRPMQLATYFCSGDVTDTGNNDWGHYALAVPLYTHFTSPLRRYPDIIVHRTLAATLEAEEMLNLNGGRSLRKRCFTGLSFDKEEVGAFDVQKALSDAAMKHAVPCTETLGGVAAHCNERKLASRYVKDATDKLYMWLLLRNKEVFLSEARVLGLGPKFMSIYIAKLAIERRIYYDEVEGLTAEWLEVTSTLVLTYSPNNRSHKRGTASKFKPIEEAAMVTFPDISRNSCNSESESSKHAADVEPAVFPLVLHLLSTVPVALHPIGGDDGPLDIGARLYTASYFC